MSAPEYLLVQNELSAVHSRLDTVAQGLALQREAEARSSILLAMDSIILAEDLLRESHPAATNEGSGYQNALQCFHSSLSHSLRN
jgi:hypothetical protein